MHKIMKLLKGKQSGQALILALALLGVGSLLIAPMLSFMGTGLNAGVIAEDKMDELYDADAGVQDAMWKINNSDEVPGLPTTDGDPPLVYSIPILNSEVDEEIDVIIDYLSPENSGTYRVRSWVGESWVDYETRIDAIIATLWPDYYDFLNHVITSGGEIDLNPPGGGPSSPDIIPDDPDHANGPRDNHPLENWPPANELIDWYMRDVDHLDPYPFDEIDVKDVSPLPYDFLWSI